MVKSYILASKTIYESNEIDAVDCAKEAFLISLNHNPRLKPEFSDARNNIINTINSFSRTKPRWCLGLIKDIVVKHPEEFTKSQLDEVKSITTTCSTEDNDFNFMIKEGYIKVDNEMARIVMPNTYNPGKAAERLAQLNIDESALSKGPSCQHHLLQAEKIYRDSGLEEKADSILAMIEQDAKNPDFFNELKSIDHEITITKEEIDSGGLLFDKAPDKGQFIATYFTPSWGKTNKTGSRLNLPKATTYDNNNMPISNNSVVDEMSLSYKFHISLAELIVKPKIKSGEFTIRDIEPQLKKIKKLDPDTYASVSLGVEYLFANKPYEALAILLPQMEDLMRMIAKNISASYYQKGNNPNIVEPKLLGGILKALKETYGDTIYHFLHYTLIDTSGYNIRNQGAHGKLKLATPDLDRKMIAILQCYMCMLSIL